MTDRTIPLKLSGRQAGLLRTHLTSIPGQWARDIEREIDRVARWVYRTRRVGDGVETEAVLIPRPAGDMGDAA